MCARLDLVPATINLAGAEVELVSEMARENRLKDAIGALRRSNMITFSLIAPLP